MIKILWSPKLNRGPGLWNHPPHDDGPQKPRVSCPKCGVISRLEDYAIVDPDEADECGVKSGEVRPGFVCPSHACDMAEPIRLLDYAS